MSGAGISVAVLIFGIAIYFYSNLGSDFSADRLVLVDKTADQYDYIVVGSGSAGSVVASRLAEDKENSVLILEAGGFYDEDPNMHIPQFWTKMMHSAHDWNYFTEPQKEASKSLKDGRSYWPRGRVLGGSSAINAMQYTRGSPFEFDVWEKQGCTGWGYKDVLPYFLKSENIQIPELMTSKYHSTGGPLIVTDGQWSPLAKLYIQAARELGNNITDYNGLDQQGYSPTQLTIRNGERSSTGIRFIGSKGKRENLDVSVNSHVTKVKIENKKAKGVYYIRNGRKYYVKANKEIVLSAGAVNSPQILMLSGIGPKRHLQDMNIPIVADLPVGQNLQDHQMVFPFTRINKPYSMLPADAEHWWTQLKYKLFHTGQLAFSGLEATAFIHLDKSEIGKTSPNIQLIFYSMFTPLNFLSLKEDIAKDYFAKSMNEHGFGTIIGNTHPKSKGNITLRSNDPFDQPVINPGYFTDPADVKELIGGIREWEQLLETKTMKDLGADISQMKFSICSQHSFRSDAYWECFIRHLGVTLYHHTSTCKMGPANNPNSVVDPQLRVKGIDGLRVADASVFPDVTSGNTNAPTIMVAERAADMIRGKLKL